MKKIYQIPEIEIVMPTLKSKYMVTEPSEGVLPDIESNESKTFDEGEINVDNRNSSLWED